MNRALKIKLLNGLEGCIPLDTTMLNEVDSAEEFITIIEKFRSAIRKFNDRNPDLKFAVTYPKKTMDLNDIIHDIINSRKYINFPDVSTNMRYYDLLYKLDFTTETISLYSLNPTTREQEEIGTMHINSMFSNWKDLFYEGHEELEKWKDDEDEEDGEWIPAEEESLYDYMRPKMEHQLDDKQMELWDLLMSNIKDTDLPENCTFKVNYSGSGDSGDIDSFNIYYDKEGSYVSERIESHFDSDTCNKMYSLAWVVIDQEEPGFVNNDGGYGEMEISATKFSWEHYNYYTETNQTIGMDVDFSEDEGKLPSEIEDSMEATAPKSKAEVTLEDIVGKYHPEILKGSDFDFDKITTTDRKPPEISF